MLGRGRGRQVGQRQGGGGDDSAPASQRQAETFVSCLLDTDDMKEMANLQNVSIQHITAAEQKTLKTKRSLH